MYFWGMFLKRFQCFWNTDSWKIQIREKWYNCNFETTDGVRSKYTNSNQERDGDRDKDYRVKDRDANSDIVKIMRI